jgi:hypothetical protein
MDLDIIFGKNIDIRLHMVTVMISSCQVFFYNDLITILVPFFYLIGA